MRKLWYAGAALTGGIILFAASPAQADLPGVDAAAQQADERLADLLGQSNGVTLGNPLGYSTLKNTPVGKSPVVQAKTGANSPNLDPLLPGQAGEGKRRGLIPGTESARNLPQDDDLDTDDLDADDLDADDLDADDLGADNLDADDVDADDLGADDLGADDLDSDADDADDLDADASDLDADDSSLDADEPDADVVGEPTSIEDLFGAEGLPQLNGLLPNGQSRDFDEQPTERRAARFRGGVPLLGGLGGSLPANESPRTLPATDEPDVSGLPLGGVAILPAATAPTSSPSTASPTAVAKPAPAPAGAKPAHTKAAPHKQAKPAPTATPYDPRLHEEPVDTDDDADSLDEQHN